MGCLAVVGVGVESVELFVGVEDSEQSVPPQDALWPSAQRDRKYR